MCDVYTWFIAWSSKRQRDFQWMNEQKRSLTQSHSWFNLMLRLQELVNKIGVTVRLLQQFKKLQIACIQFQRRL